MTELIEVCPVEDLKPGDVRLVEGEDLEIGVINCAGTFYAIEDVCTHDGGPLDQGELQGCRIMCPRHGALFDVTSGAALTLPAVVPLDTYAVRTDGDEVLVDL